MGCPWSACDREGAIYVSARFALHGMRTPDGAAIESDEDVRKYLLNAVGLAAIPFNAFGSQSDAGWFRLSIGVVSVAQIEAVLPRAASCDRGARTRARVAIALVARARTPFSRLTPVT